MEKSRKKFDRKKDVDNMEFSKKEIEEMYQEMRRSDFYLSGIESAKRDFITFMRPENTYSYTMGQVYSFYKEDNQRYYAMGEPFWILDLFVLKATALYFNCNVDKIDEEVLAALEKDLIFQYKEQFGEMNYKNMCNTMWDIFMLDPRIFKNLSVKAYNRIRMTHDNCIEIWYALESKLCECLRNTGGMAAAARTFFSDYTSLLLPIMHRSAADEVLILYCLKSLSREWGCDCPGINWKVKKLVEGNALEANKSFFNETDYTMLLRMEGIIREEF